MMCQLKVSRRLELLVAENILIFNSVSRKVNMVQSTGDMVRSVPLTSSMKADKLP